MQHLFYLIFGLTFSVIACQSRTTSQKAPDQLQARDTLVHAVGYKIMIPRPNAYHWSVIGVLPTPEYSIAFESPTQDPSEYRIVIGATLYSGLGRQSTELLESFDRGAKIK